MQTGQPPASSAKSSPYRLRRFLHTNTLISSERLVVIAGQRNSKLRGASLPYQQENRPPDSYSRGRRSVPMHGSKALAAVGLASNGSPSSNIVEVLVASPPTTSASCLPRSEEMLHPYGSPPPIKHGKPFERTSDCHDNVTAVRNTGSSASVSHSCTDNENGPLSSTFSALVEFALPSGPHEQSVPPSPPAAAPSAIVTSDSAAGVVPATQFLSGRDWRDPNLPDRRAPQMCVAAVATPYKSVWLTEGSCRVKVAARRAPSPIPTPEKLSREGPSHFDYEPNSTLTCCSVTPRLTPLDVGVTPPVSAAQPITECPNSTSPVLTTNSQFIHHRVLAPPATSRGGEMVRSAPDRDTVRPSTSQGTVELSDSQQGGGSSPMPKDIRRMAATFGHGTVTVPLPTRPSTSYSLDSRGASLVLIHPVPTSTHTGSIIHQRDHSVAPARRPRTNRSPRNAHRLSSRAATGGTTTVVQSFSALTTAPSSLVLRTPQRQRRPPITAPPQTSPKVPLSMLTPAQSAPPIAEQYGPLNERRRRELYAWNHYLRKKLEDTMDAV